MLGDWVPGTKIKVEIINITVDDAGKINHVGIGYHVVVPSGRVVASRGWTWDPEKHPESLQGVVTALIADLCSDEGFDGLVDPVASGSPC